MDISSCQIMFIAFQIPYAIGKKNKYLKFFLSNQLRNYFLFIATAANIRVGQFLGANKPEEAINAAKVTYFLTSKIFEKLIL